MVDPEQGKELADEVFAFRSRIEKMVDPHDRQAAALTEIAIELKWLRVIGGSISDSIDDIANKP